MFVCPFPTDPKFQNLGKLRLLFFFFFFDIHFCIFKQNCYHNFFKMHCNCPKSYTEGMCLPTCLHQIVGCHLFRYRKLYDLCCISSTSRFKKRKERSTYRFPPPQFSGQKGKQTLNFSGLMLLNLLKAICNLRKR